MKIAVMGSASSSVHRAPFKNEQYREYLEGRVESIQQAHDSVPGEWDIWGCSPGCWAVVPRATRWFEVHRWEVGVPWFSPEYVQFLRTFKGPVYTGGKVPEIQNHVVYPLDYIEEKFASYFLTSSLSLMMALAIDTIEQVRAARRVHQENKSRMDAGIPADAGIPTANLGVPQMSSEQFEVELAKTDDDDVIGLWGVDMAAADEYAYQRPGCQFFVLEALRRGIGVYLPPESDLMRPQPVYGISEWDHNYIKLTSRSREINSAAGEAQKQVAELTQRVTALSGEQHALQAFVSTWTSPYGMMAGLVLRQQPGTGLGSGITQFDGRPVSRMTLGAPAPAPEGEVVQAMTESPEAQLGKVLLEIVRTQPGHNGTGEGILNLARQNSALAEVARIHTGLIQPYAHAGESTAETLQRLIVAAVTGKRAKKPALARKRAGAKRRR